MAGDWIKIEHVTTDKPEVYRIAEILGIDPDAVVGKLIRLWIWADQQTIDGNARSVTSALINRVTVAEKFSAALEAVGWLVVEGDKITFPNFDRHNGNTAKQRALTAKRVAKLKRKGNAASVTPALAKEEKRRDLSLGEPSSPSAGEVEDPKPIKPKGRPTFAEFQDAAGISGLIGRGVSASRRKKPLLALPHGAAERYCLLTKSEMNHFGADHGQEFVTYWIEAVQEFAKTKPSKFAAFSDHSDCIRNWHKLKCERIGGEWARKGPRGAGYYRCDELDRLEVQGGKNGTR